MCRRNYSGWGMPPPGHVGGGHRSRGRCPPPHSGGRFGGHGTEAQRAQRHSMHRGAPCAGVHCMPEGAACPQGRCMRARAQCTQGHCTRAWAPHAHRSAACAKGPARAPGHRTPTGAQHAHMGAACALNARYMQGRCVHRNAVACMYNLGSN